MKHIIFIGLLFILNCGADRAYNAPSNEYENASAKPSNSRILFSRSKGPLNSGHTIDLMIFDPVTRKTSLLLKGTVKKRGEYNAAVSPDNEYIILNTYRFGGWKLGVGKLTGNKISNVRRFTKRPNYEYNAKYSPDGSKVVYQEFSWSTNDTDIFIVDRNGNKARHFVNSKGGDRTPDWTNDGKSIVFTSGRNDNYKIYMKSIMDGSLRKLTGDIGSDFAPSTSKAENKIAFLSDREGRINLFVSDLDGKSLKNLTPDLKSDRFSLKDFDGDGGWAYKTSWSPDGKQIVFNAIVDGNLELFIVDKDGDNLTQITNNSDSDISPFWTH